MTKIKQKKYSILSGILKYSFVFIIAFSIFMPFMFAGANVAIDAKIANPLGPNGPQTLTDFIEAIVNIVLVIGVPILVLAIIYAGFLYVKAQGNPGELEVAHRTLLYTVIGGVLLLGAFVIANAIGKTVEDIKSTT
jgi:hypothetical protein